MVQVYLLRQLQPQFSEVLIHTNCELFPKGILAHSSVKTLSSSFRDNGGGNRLLT